MQIFPETNSETIGNEMAKSITKSDLKDTKMEANKAQHVTNQKGI